MHADKILINDLLCALASLREKKIVSRKDAKAQRSKFTDLSAKSAFIRG
jgi:hypothetical protein